MKAVNLIPAEERRGAGGAAGRTGGAAHILIAALGLLVLMIGAYATTSRSLGSKRSQLAVVQQKATASEARAAALAPYAAFASMRESRVATVKSIADSRFDWSHAMHELGRTLPRNITLTGIRGTVSSGVGVPGVTVPLRAALNVPAIEMAGCAPSQAAIPPMLASLRQVDGVRRVALQQSVAGQGNAAPADPGTGAVKAPDCSRSFQVVIFFDPRPAVAAPAAATTTPATGAAVPTAAPTTQTTSAGAAK